MAKTAPKKTTEELYAWDAEKRQGGLLLCGVDEAGRGPLAGDVYAAAVILDPSRPLVAGLNDSKKMTEKKRDALFEEVKSACLAYCVASASVEEIETLNILGATMLAMQRAVAGLSMQPGLVLIDGNRLPQLSVPAETVVKGDATSASIAAASILAKVSRDRTLYELDEMYPQYGFAKHKGYGTKAHCEAILQYGPCPAHRPSFLRKLYQNHENENNCDRSPGRDGGLPPIGTAGLFHRKAQLLHPWRRDRYYCPECGISGVRGSKNTKAGKSDFRV